MANTDYTMYELYEYIQNPGIPVKGGENLTVHPNYVDWNNLRVGSTDIASYSYEFNVASLFEVGKKHIDTIILQGTEGSTWKNGNNLRPCVGKPLMVWNYKYGE